MDKKQAYRTTEMPVSIFTGSDNQRHEHKLIFFF